MGDNLEEKRGRGRPRKDGSRNHVYAVRFSEKEEALIKQCEAKTGMNKSDFIRLCVQVYANLIGEN